MYSIGLHVLGVASLFTSHLGLHSCDAGSGILEVHWWYQTQPDANAPAQLIFLVYKALT